MSFDKEKAKKIASIAGNTLIWLFVIFSLIITILVFSAQSSSDGIPALFGKSLITVSTDSMKDEFSAGDLIIMERVYGDAILDLEVDEVITFYAPIDIDGDGKAGDINTHRIVEKHIDRESGSGYFVTKGDNNPLKDNEGSDGYTVAVSDVIGRYTGTRFAGLGAVISFLRSSLGFFIFIVLPLIVFFIYELYRFIALLLEERAKKNPKKISPEQEEEIKRRAIEEYLKTHPEDKDNNGDGKAGDNE